MNKINIYTDGSVLTNPDGAGGWAAVICYPDGRQTRMSGAEESTTNNRMEMTAALMALLAVEPFARGLNAEIELHTDSKYVQMGMTQWLATWKVKGWISSTGSAVSNQDLWNQLDEVSSGIDVSWSWVRGHVGHPENEVADQMAGQAARSKAGQTIHLTAEQLSTGEYAATTPTGKPRASVVEVDTTMSDEAIAALIRDHLGIARGKSVRFRQVGG